MLVVTTATSQVIPAGSPASIHESLDRYWEESLSGGPPKDGIPSIDDPRFMSRQQADRWLDDNARVIGIYHAGEARAYPQSILVWHEIVNDKVGGKPIAVSYCPLTGTALGFERGEDELGVSGRLVNSNLIMYNRANDTYWPQILAAGIHGELKGEGLREIRVIWTDWKRWKTRYPETRVLSRRTGHARNYRRDPYGSYGPKSGYYASDDILFPVFSQSDQFPPKHVVFGFRTEHEAVAVDTAVLAEAGVLQYSGKQADFLIIHDAGLDTAWVYQGEHGMLPEKGSLLAELKFNENGPEAAALDRLEAVNGFEAMWFAWYAFYPDTAVVDALD